MRSGLKLSELQRGSAPFLEWLRKRVAGFPPDYPTSPPPYFPFVVNERGRLAPDTENGASRDFRAYRAERLPFAQAKGHTVKRYNLYTVRLALTGRQSPDLSWQEDCRLGPTPAAALTLKKCSFLARQRCPYSPFARLSQTPAIHSQIFTLSFSEIVSQVAYLSPRSEKIVPLVVVALTFLQSFDGAADASTWLVLPIFVNEARYGRGLGTGMYSRDPSSASLCFLRLFDSSNGARFIPVWTSC